MGKQPAKLSLLQVQLHKEILLPTRFMVSEALVLDRLDRQGLPGEWHQWPLVLLK